MSSFTQPAFNRDTLREYRFFLIYYGKGFDAQSIGRMEVDELKFYVKKLNTQLQTEQRAQQEAIAKQKAQAASQRARSKFRF